MDDQAGSLESSWTTRKIVRAALIVMILVLFPLISWMYLRGGIEFRKEALAALEQKGTIGQVFLINKDSKEYILGAGNKRVFACFLISGSISNDVLSSINAYHQQFKATGEVDVLVFYDGDEVPKGLVLEDIVFLNSKLDSNAAFVNQLKSFSDTSDVFLLDIAGNLRNFYDYNADNVFRNLVTHTAVLIPPNNNRSVRQKNNSEL